MRRPAGRRARLAETMAVRLAAGVAGLLLAAGLVVRVSVPLTATSPQVQTRLEERGSAIALSTDVSRRPLFDDVALVAGVPAEACIHVRAHGPVADDPLRFHLTGVRGDQALADALRIEVAQHAGTPTDADGGCDGFTAGHVLLSGALTDVARVHRDEARSVPGTQAGTAWYRVRVTLPADATAGGRIDSLGLAWTSAAISATPGTAERVMALAVGIAEGSLVPLLLMLVISVLFVGVQNRIDSSDPKLALAPVAYEELVFE